VGYILITQTISLETVVLYAGCDGYYNLTFSQNTSITDN